MTGITLWISSCIATARERIPGSIANYVTGVSECSQQRGNLKDDGYKTVTGDYGTVAPSSAGMSLGQRADIQNDCTLYARRDL
ncbi:hypothetical protein [Photorhabdus sp. RW14-46]|uniref:hypothetical protein n=1 Tax=Photorhabdus sp. RW14-46 TaxID=2100168 RepID=UPI001F61EC9A|nr:hypothetical protein [Photorhabdus sp. RW14-46]